MNGKLPDAELEEAYDLIAEALDRVGAKRESMFLAKLCLALASNADSLDAVRRAIDVAVERVADTEDQ